MCLLYFWGLNSNEARKAEGQAPETTQQEQVSKPMKQVSG